MPAPIASAAAGLAAAFALRSSTIPLTVDCALDFALSTQASFAANASCFSSSVKDDRVVGDRRIARSAANFARARSTSCS